jgi:hypothetical protein
VHDPLHVDAGRVHAVRVDLARLDEVLDLRDRYSTGYRAVGVEVPCAAPVHEVAVPVALPGVHEREVGDDRLLQHVGAAAELAGVLPRRHQGDGAVGVVPPREATIGDQRADPGRGEERRDPGAAGTQPLGQRALRGQLQLELAGQVLAGELLVVAHVGADRAPDPASGQQGAQPEAVDAEVVAHRLQVGGALLEQRRYQGGRHAAHPESADGDRGTVADLRDGLGGRRYHFVDHDGIRSNTAARPWPPPMHMVSRP